MNFVVSGISLGVWSGMAAGVGASVFLPRVSFKKAALIGGTSVAGAAVAVTLAVLIQDIFFGSLKNGGPHSFENFLKNWSWVAMIPLVGVPYLGGVTGSTGVALVAFGVTGAALKAFTVGVLPDKG